MESTIIVAVVAFAGIFIALIVIGIFGGKKTSPTDAPAPTAKDLAEFVDEEEKRWKARR